MPLYGYAAEAADRDARREAAVDAGRRDAEDGYRPDPDRNGHDVDAYGRGYEERSR